MNQQLINDLMSSVHGYLWGLRPDGYIVFPDHVLRKYGIRPRPVSLQALLRFAKSPFRIPLSQALLNPSVGEVKRLEVQIVEPHTAVEHMLMVLINSRSSQASSFVSTGIIQITDRAHKIEKERRNAYRQSEETSAKESFLATMGHEIRNPLNVIIGYAELLTSQYHDLDDEMRLTYGEQIMESNTQLLQLLDSVMDRTESTPADLHMELNRRQVSTFMEDICLTQSVIVPKRLAFNYRRGTENVFFRVNRSAMLQVISNLVNNAIKFTPQGSITMGWEVDGDEVVIYVEDTGIGVPEENQEKIFSEYYKEDYRTIGAGIGLPLCRYLVGHMNGTIGVKSKLGKGSRFEIRLPKE